jgi:hypothetical protein
MKTSYKQNPLAIASDATVFPVRAGTRSLAVGVFGRPTDDA